MNESTLVPCTYCPTWLQQDGPHGLMRHVPLYHAETPLAREILAARIQAVSDHLARLLQDKPPGGAA
jgi:hypothetical protein